MIYAVTVEPLNAIFFLAEPPEEGRWPVQEGVGLDVPSNYLDWPEGGERPEQILCVSKSNPAHYKVFKHRKDIDPAEYQPTGRYFGGVYSRSAWERFVKTLPDVPASQEIAAADPPEAIDEAVSALRRER